jgi:hypothetical protein
MMGSSMLDRANDLLDRVSKLDDAVTNLQEFRSLLEVLNARIDLPPLTVDPVRMIQAGILRSAIALIVAILDSRGSDRASLGQIVALLKDNKLVEFFLKKYGQGSNDTMNKKLVEVCNRYNQICIAQSFQWVKQLRNVEIGHILMAAPIPTIRLSDVYILADEIEQQVITLYEGLGIASPPNFSTEKRQTIEHANLFWNTYFLGRAANKPRS